MIQIKRITTKKVALYFATNPAEPIDTDLIGWKGPGWYFWDEVQTHLIGPWNTEEEAINKYEEYGKQLSGR